MPSFQVLPVASVFCQTEDVFKEAPAVHVVVLCLLRGLALLPPSKPQQLLLCRSSVSLRFHIDEKQRSNLIHIF